MLAHGIVRDLKLFQANKKSSPYKFKDLKPHGKQSRSQIFPQVQQKKAGAKKLVHSRIFLIDWEASTR